LEVSEEETELYVNVEQLLMHEKLI